MSVKEISVLLIVPENDGGMPVSTTRLPLFKVSVRRVVNPPSTLFGTRTWTGEVFCMFAFCFRLCLLQCRQTGQPRFHRKGMRAEVGWMEGVHVGATERANNKVARLRCGEMYVCTLQALGWETLMATPIEESPSITTTATTTSSSTTSLRVRRDNFTPHFQVLCFHLLF